MLKKIHIFKAGNYGESEARKWNNDEVRQLANNYDFNYRRAMVKLGHDGFFDDERPAVGWVKSLEYEEDKQGKGNLYANVDFIDDEINNIKDRYINVSIEAVKEIGSYDQNTDKRGAYLLGVALLGSSQPAVPELEPVKFSKEKEENFIITGLFSESEFFFNSKKDDTIQKKGDIKMTELEKLQAELAKFKKEKEDLASKLQEFKEKERKDKIVGMIDNYSKKIIPAVKDELVEFSISLDDTQLEAFKKILDKMPELSIFKNVEMEEKEPQPKKKDLRAEALEDIEAFKKLYKGV